MAWQLMQCNWDEKVGLEAYLKEGWEPFAVTETEYAPTIWLRRPGTPEDAGIVELPRRPRGEPEVMR